VELLFHHDIKFLLDEKIHVADDGLELANEVLFFLTLHQLPQDF
jgi:hypothetical protein